MCLWLCVCFLLPPVLTYRDNPSCEVVRWKMPLCRNSWHAVWLSGHMMCDPMCVRTEDREQRVKSIRAGEVHFVTWFNPRRAVINWRPQTEHTQILSGELDRVCVWSQHGVNDWCSCELCLWWESLKLYCLPGSEIRFSKNELQLSER